VRLCDLVHEGAVCCFGEPTFLVQEGEDSHWLLKQVDGWLQIQTEVDELPFDALAFVFLSNENENCSISRKVLFLAISYFYL
jgi:hypothetical protein